MEKQYKMVKFKMSSWRMLRRAFYGRKNETFSEYIERIAKEKNELTSKQEDLILARRDE